MELYITYGFWSILPIFLLISFVRGKFREATNARRPGKRHGDLFHAGSYCLVFLVICIIFNELFFAEFLEKQLEGTVDFLVFNWLLYPAVLLTFSQIEELIKKKKEKQAEAEEKERKSKLPHKY